MGARIGPERARELREGAQPGPWRTETIDGALHVLVPSGNGAPEEADLPLIAAAPDLAEIVAGMEWEYTVYVYLGDEAIMQWGFEEAEVGSWTDELGRAEYVRDALIKEGRQARLVRRLVTDVEVVE